MKRPLRYRQQGLSLIELMISITLGLIILAALVAVFSQNSNSFRQNDAVAEMQDNSRFALEALTRDLSMAGFVGGIYSAADVTTNPALTISPDCGNGVAMNGVTTPWFQLATQRVEFQDNATTSSTFTCLGQTSLGSELQANSDIVAIRRAAGQPTASMLATDTKPTLNSNTFYLQSNGTQGSLINSHTLVGSGGIGLYTLATSSASDVPQNPPMSFYVWKPRVYFVRPYAHSSTESPLVPALCRMELQNTATAGMQVECLADGVQNLQIEWGLDTDGDCVPDKYTTGPSASDLQTAVTARIWLLMRTAKPEAGYTDTKTYTMANMGTFGPANDHYRRRVYTTTVQLRNPNNTNGPCVQAPAASATSTR